MNPQTTDTDRLHFLAHRSFRAPGPTKFHPVYCIVDSSVWAPRPCVPNEKLNALREAIDASMPPSAEPRHAPADSASAQLAAITADRDEWKADSERLKAREVTLTDRQCLVQLAFTESGFNYESGEGLPELAKRVAGMASAYRARDNIGMSREEYHKAKDALGQLAAMREERDRLTFDLKNEREGHFLLRNRVLHAADSKEARSACEQIMREEFDRNRSELIDDLRAQLAAAQSEVGRLTKELEEEKERAVQAEYFKEQTELQLKDPQVIHTMALRHCTAAQLAHLGGEHRTAELNELATLRRERDDWKARFTDLNNSLMAELRDPSGTIWEHAKALQEERDELRGKLGMDTPWPAELLFKALVIAERKLREDGRDFDGWESIQSAAQVAQSRIDSARAKQGEGQP